MILINKNYVTFLNEAPIDKLSDLTKNLKMKKKMISKINSLREQAGLNPIG